MQKERRYPREKLAKDIMCFTEYGGEAGMGRSYFFATLVDVSKDGAGIKTEQDCIPNDEIWLHDPGLVSESVPGKVIWAKKTGDLYNLGLYFSEH